MDVVNQRRKRRIVERAIAGHGIAQRCDARWLFSRMNVVGGELADRPFLLHVGKSHSFPGKRLGEIMSSSLLALWPLE